RRRHDRPIDLRRPAWPRQRGRRPPRPLTPRDQRCTKQEPSPQQNLAAGEPALIRLDHLAIAHTSTIGTSPPPAASLAPAPGPRHPSLPIGRSPCTPRRRNPGGLQEVIRTQPRTRSPFPAPY